jgi:Zn-dependent protease with chaperone function
LRVVPGNARPHSSSATAIATWASGAAEAAPGGLAVSSRAATQVQASLKVTAYTLPPDLYKKARNLGRIRFRLALLNFFYGLVVLWVILRWKFSSKYRDWAEGRSSRRILQALAFSPLLILTVDVFTLPTDIYGQWVSRRYGISVQGWRSWAWDWTKGEFLGIVLGTVLIAILYAALRKSPRRWWFYFWLISLPLGLFLVFVQPLIIDPMFHKFQPLAEKDPALTASLETMVQHAGVEIPPERMFWMGAREKTTALNAYVTGVGSSKRIVVWDTTIAKMSTAQIVFVAGHEMGHYVLRHVAKGLAAAALFLFILFYLGFRCIGWVLVRRGRGWGVRGVDDWASLPALLLLLSVFGFLANPITNAFSRHLEHQADQYGLEVTHGITSDSGQAAAQAFQAMGEVNLADPAPSRVNVFLFYSHPPLSDRIRFCLGYDPWSQGRQPEFVK